MTSAAPKHLNFITGNKNKLAEVQAILAGVIELQNQNIDLVEIQGTVEEVTTDKARRAAKAVRFKPYLFQVSNMFIIAKYVVLDSRPGLGGRHMSLLQSDE